MHDGLAGQPDSNARILIRALRVNGYTAGAQVLAREAVSLLAQQASLPLLAISEDADVF